MNERNRSTMKLDYSTEDLATLISRVQEHFESEFELELGRFEAEELVDFFTQQIGAHFYNRGLYDAQSVMLGKIEDLNDAIYQLEQPVDIG
ncbi:DUF2164 domain-containing protein [Ciceribacter sp. L1K22]|uniref:DUF2164 domain-containing protein n=1 Tax=Ciceribacter sp. L1K22 TaxID=2820275 RepID=UPI001FEF411A|nr:DUF2164 domain-containing protein [Ciceribacter sp. L1K22]